MTACPYCGKPERAYIENQVWWICNTYQSSPKHQPHQSPECEALCEGRDEGQAERDLLRRRLANAVRAARGWKDWARHFRRTWKWALETVDVVAEKRDVAEARLAEALLTEHVEMASLREWRTHWQPVIEAARSVCRSGDMCDWDKLYEAVRKAEEDKP